MKNTMRTVLIATALVIALVALGGCAGDAKKIVGEWKATTFELSVISISVTYVFNADGTGYSEDSALKVKTEFTYALKDNTITMTSDDGDVVGAYDYTLEDDTLTLIQGSNATVFKRQ